MAYDREDIAAKIFRLIVGCSFIPLTFIISGISQPLTTQDDPYRSLLEFVLVAFAVRTVLKGRTRGETETKNWIQLTDKVSGISRFGLRKTAWKGGHVG